MALRPLSKTDQLLLGVDKALRAIVPHSNPSTRPLPVSNDEIPELTITEARHVSGLMRINHTGEVCAQGLYHGQAFAAKDSGVKQAMQQSAEEEVDHLVWCETRLRELGSHASVFTPLWYGMSFGLGAVAGAISNEFSLGFVAETEAQVSEHLQDHIGQLPAHDHRSKQILSQMDIEELHHRELALSSGGAALSPAVRHVMRWMANRMKATAYHL